jgi:hypothetical protein
MPTVVFALLRVPHLLGRLHCLRVQHSHGIRQLKLVPFFLSQQHRENIVMVSRRALTKK